ncbi:MAG: hypothetical protein FWG20_06895 [Candidatus Cloacimonetes bacterium]|nr:hypothetical protein [Candidatus Cloacimonadota bacterium]
MPSKPPEWNILTSTAEKCLENLVYAYNYKQNGIRYDSILSNSFEFYFDPQDVQDISVPPFWQKQQEVSVLIDAQQQGVDAESLFLSMSNIDGQNDNHNVTTVVFYRHYELWVSDLGKIYKGKLQISVEKESDGLWRIKRWYDYREGSEWTWGRMKYEYY